MIPKPGEGGHKGQNESNQRAGNTAKASTFIRQHTARTATKHVCALWKDILTTRHFNISLKKIPGSRQSEGTI